MEKLKTKAWAQNLELGSWTPTMLFNPTSSAVRKKKNGRKEAPHQDIQRYTDTKVVLLDQPVNTCRFFKKTWIPTQINNIIVLAQVLPGNPENP